MYTQLTLSPALRQSLLSARQYTRQSSLRPVVRPFSLSASRPQDLPPANRPTSELPNQGKASSSTKGDPENATRKDGNDPLSANSLDGMKAKKEGAKDSAMEGSGGEAVKKAKKDHPAAPDPAIGMQDERGGRGA
ncbi:hypothetical protein GQ43DRAFT_475549 [Delitschia confertaspora ATCC 74209]|uniref:Uncharacterized protein n=1 Tax=Delitschia confertaspora ATCC 74209 TaxID=1513339 RepID=A0A9P4MNN6_9PLEO|nr:hypothetical protein GQ43DRAFT_475549 [Delitschia confertaspora ATCC 74209]